MTTKREWDVKITQNSVEHKLRLLVAEGKKAWQVAEAPPQPQIADAAASRAGFSPERDLPFIMEDWSWGVGLDRFGSSNERAQVFRYADGFGIDTTQSGSVLHGPLAESMGSTSSGQTPIQFMLFNDEVYILTTNKLYSITSGGTLTERVDYGSVVCKRMAEFAGVLYIATDESGAYRSWTGSVAASLSVTGGASFFLAVQGSSAPILIRVYPDATTTNVNKISTNPDPSDVAQWEVTGGDIGNGNTINSLFTISGFVFAATESTVYLLAADSAGATVPIELDKRMGTRKSTNAFSIFAESGSDAWLSDGDDIFRIVAEGFETYDIRADGPFRSFDGKPINAAISGTVKSMSQDIDAVYICVDRGSDIYIYKGVEQSRGTYAWTPLAKYTGTNAASGVFKTTAEADPFIYVGNTLEILRYKTRSWSTYTPTWELETSQFTATLETWDKIWFGIQAFLKLSGATAKVEVAYKLNNTAGYTDFDDSVASNNDMTADEFNELKLAAPINGKKIRLKFTGTNSTNTHFANLRSFNLSGILRPVRKAVFDFTVVADTVTEVTFLNLLRTDNTRLFTIKDRFDVDRSAFMLPGFPIEQELFDEARKEPVRTYRIVAQEVS